MRASVSHPIGRVNTPIPTSTSSASLTKCRQVQVLRRRPTLPHQARSKGSCQTALAFPAAWSGAGAIMGPKMVRGPLPAQAVPNMKEFTPPIEELGGARSALIWFKNDLRVADHPGLHACIAAGVPQVTCLYVLDAVLMAPLMYTPGGPEILLASLENLRRELHALGCELLFKIGSAADVVPKVAAACGAQAIVVEREISHDWEAAVDASTNPLDGIRTLPWMATVWDASAFSISYKSWKGQRGQPQSPLPALKGLLSSAHPMEESDALPSVEELRFLLFDAAASCLAGPDMVEVADQVHMAAEERAESALIKKMAACVATGQCTPTQLLQMYLNPNSASLPSSLLSHLASEVAAVVEQLEVPSSKGASFPALFSTWLSLGVISRRTVMAETQAQVSLLQPVSIKAALKAMEAADFHRQLASLGSEQQRVDQSKEVSASHEIRQWSWRGHSMEYCVSEPSNPYPSAPTVMLVHGFGAFGEQWRCNAGALAAAGFRVYCPTLAGFGRSEKGALGYSQDSWRDYLRDFVLQEVRDPVVVAGNSIGGFIGSSMCADYPALGKGLILLNSAGPVNAGFELNSWQEAVEKKKPPPEIVVQLISRGLFAYLELGIERTLKWLYPTAPDRADEWLAAEIERAAGDPGSLEVFQSAFYLPPPRALNYLVQKFWAGPTLVLQGILDPLNDARGRAGDMKTILGNRVSVVLLEAGHCPMDEQPEQVNESMIKFIKEEVMEEKEVITPAALATL